MISVIHSLSLLFWVTPSSPKKNNEHHVVYLHWSIHFLIRSVFRYLVAAAKMAGNLHCFNSSMIVFSSSPLSSQKRGLQTWWCAVRNFLWCIWEKKWEATKNKWTLRGFFTQKIKVIQNQKKNIAICTRKKGNDCWHNAGATLGGESFTKETETAPVFFCMFHDPSPGVRRSSSQILTWREKSRP